jgi:hypothetical protein
MALSANFMHGDFTIDDDRYNLIDVAVSLYYLILQSTMYKKAKTAKDDEQAKLLQIVEIIQNRREAMYPKAIFEDHMEIVEQEVKEEGSSTFKRSSTASLILGRTSTSKVSMSEVSRSSRPSKERPSKEVGV